MNEQIDKMTLRIKAWWRSATVWLGGAVIVLANMADVLPILDTTLHPILSRIINSAVGVAIIYLRLFSTNQAVTVSAAMKPVSSDKIVTPDGQP